MPRLRNSISTLKRELSSAKSGRECSSALGETCFYEGQIVMLQYLLGMTKDTSYESFESDDEDEDDEDDDD